MPQSLRTRILLLFAAGLAGCTTVKHLFDSDRVDRADKAGSVHVAVLAVAPWDKVKEDLQPKFELTPAQAYDQAIPVTQQLIERVLDALSASLKIALPTQSVAQTTTRTETTGQADSETSTRTEERKPGDPSKVQSGTPPTGGVPTPFSAAPALDSRAVDPMLRYQAATALYQEVKILNQYVANAMKREGYTPYLVRLQVSVFPNKRNLPYDTYANIAFYSARERLHRSVQLSTLRGGSRLRGPTSLFATETEPEFRGSSASARTILMQHPVVIPLLVTDNLESLLHESAIQSVRQSAVGLLAVLKSIGIGANVDSLQNELQAVLGKDLNSLLTVARMSDNTVRVRLGAMSQPQSGHAMIPRTHNISLMVLVPDQATHVKVMTEADFRDVESGKVLDHRDSAELRENIRKVWKKYELPDLPTPRHYSLVANAIYFNDFANFSEVMTEIEDQIRENERDRGGDAPAGRAYPFGNLNLFTYLWVDLIGTRVGSSFSQASFDVPKPETTVLSTCPAAGQTPVLFDDGSNTAAALYNGKDLDPAKLDVLLKVTCSAQSYEFAPERLVAAADRKTLQLGFASLKALLPQGCLASQVRQPTLTLGNCVPGAANGPVSNLRKKMNLASSLQTDLEDLFQDFVDRRKNLGDAHTVARLLAAAALPVHEVKNVDRKQLAVARLQTGAPAELKVFAGALKKAIAALGEYAGAPDDVPPETLDRLKEALSAVTAASTKALEGTKSVENAFEALDPGMRSLAVAGADAKALSEGVKSLDEAVDQGAQSLGKLAVGMAALGKAVDSVAVAARKAETFEARYTEKPAAVAAPLALNATQVVADERGEGSVFVVVVEKFDAAKEVRLLRISGADVKSFDPNLTREGNGWKLAPSTAITLSLRNLSPLTELSVWATNEKGGAIGKPIQLKVVQQSAKKDTR